MRVAVFSTHTYDRTFLDAANRKAGSPHELRFLDLALDLPTSALAQGSDAICVFVNDRLSAPVLEALAASGIRLAVLRAAGFNNVDIQAAEKLGITVLRVPAYSPHSVAEHALALIMTLNRKTHRAVSRVREQNFALDGLLGFDLAGKTVGVIGTGQIGAAFTGIMLGLGCRVVAFDPQPNPECVRRGVEYLSLAELLLACDVISLHCPLTPSTRHLVNADSLARMKPGVMLINTSRGAVIDTRAVIQSLKSGHIGYLGLDVYEEEGDLFFRDLSGEVIQDDVFARLLTFPNVVITAHQAFFTREALNAIATTTIRNLSDFAAGQVNPCNRVTTGCFATTHRA